MLTSLAHRALLQPLAGAGREARRHRSTASEAGSRSCVLGLISKATGTQHRGFWCTDT